MSRAFMVKQAPFKPTDIGGCQLWLDGADITTQVFTGASITVWRDKSGNGYHMNQLPSDSQVGVSTFPTAGTAINGQSTVYFNLTAGLKQTTLLDGAKNMYWVGRISSIGFGVGYSCYFLFGSDTTVDWHGNFYSSTNTMFLTQYASSGVYNAYPTSLYTTDSNAIVNTTFSNVYFPTAPSVSILSVAGLTGSTKYQGICYDRTQHSGWCGDLAEVLVFSNALTTPQRQQVESYLAQKWGLKATLPQGHPGTRGIVYPQLPLPNASALPYPSAFIPTQIQSGTCQLWLDAEDIFGNGTVPSNGATVSTWTDKSGKGYNAVTYGAAPSYVSNKSIQFTGPSNTNMRSPVPAQTFTTGMTLFVVFVKTIGANTYETLVTRTVTSEPAPFDMYNTNRIWGSSNNYIAGTAASFTTYTTQTLLSITMSTSLNWLEYINGTNTVSYNITNYNNGSFGTPTWNDTASYIYIGTRADSITRFTGQISEILAYTSTLSTLDRQKVEGYLAWKWGLQSSLDASNPYKNAAPTVPNALGISRPANVLPIPSIGCYPTRTYFLVTAGLVFHIDAGNPASYPGSGSTWYDLTTSGLNVTLYGGPTYSSANGGSLLFVPTSLQYGQTSAPLDLPLWTLEAWTYYNGTNTGNWPNVITDMYTGNLQYCLGNTNNGALSTGYLSGSWYSTSTYTITSGNWYHMVGTYDGTNLKLYVNGVLQRTAAGTSTPVNGGAGFRIMRQWDGNGVAYWGGNLSIARMYNRALSASEVNTNYQVSKARFGLS